MQEANSQIPTRERILDAASRLIAAEGIDAATTRAVSVAAGVQAPAIYRLFGDKDGLLDAVAEHVMHSYVSRKTARKPLPDPLDELRAGWDAHIDFALTHPEIYRVILLKDASGGSSASQKGRQVLAEKIAAVAAEGRLQVPVQQAVDLFHAIAAGTILSVLGRDREQCVTLSADAREAAISAMTGGKADPGTDARAAAAISLRAGLGGLEGFTAGEKLLFGEFLDRIGQKDVMG